MRTIMILNAKGGSGKTTLATNLAAYYALQGKSVVLADLDSQGSSIDWLKARPESRPAIRGIATWREPLRVAAATDYVIFDTPAASHGQALARLIRYAQTVIVPVLPSPLDIRAAREFVHEVQRIGKVARHNIQDAALIAFLKSLFGDDTGLATTRVAVVANRVRENTIAYDTLYEFLDKLKIPFVTTLRDTQNYIQAAERGLGLCELAPSQVAYDLEQWEPLIRWLNSKRSLPV